MIESAVNAVYWFPFYYTFKFVFLLWLSLPQTGSVLILSHHNVSSTDKFSVARKWSSAPSSSPSSAAISPSRAPPRPTSDPRSIRLVAPTRYRLTKTWNHIVVNSSHNRRLKGEKVASGECSPEDILRMESDRARRDGEK